MLLEQTWIMSKLSAKINLIFIFIWKIVDKLYERGYNAQGKDLYNKPSLDLNGGVVVIDFISFTRAEVVSDTDDIDNLPEVRGFSKACFTELFQLITLSQLFIPY